MDPDKHLDLQQLGWDKCTQAMEEAIASDKAEPIFQQAADKFQEVAATGAHFAYAQHVAAVVASRWPEGCCSIETSEPQRVQLLSQQAAETETETGVTTESLLQLLLIADAAVSCAAAQTLKALYW